MSKEFSEDLDCGVAEWFEKALEKAHGYHSAAPAQDANACAAPGGVAECEQTDELRLFDEKLAQANEAIEEWMLDEVERGVAAEDVIADELVLQLYEELKQWVEAQPETRAVDDGFVDQLSAQKEARRRAEEQANEAMMDEIQSLLAGPNKGASG